MPNNRIEVIDAANLTAAHVQSWASIQEAEPSLDSSFFRPEFTQMVASVRNDVEVAILHQGDQAVGFFPYQRGRRRVAEPVAGRLSELHGVIAPNHVSWDAESLTRACRIATWRFDHLLASQTPFREFAFGTEPSPYMDLSDGYDAFVEQKRQSGSTAVKQVMRKSRKLEREVGPLRFEFDTDDDRAFDALLKWKAMQYQRSKKLDLFRYRWVTDLLDRARKTRDDGFGGAMSALFAGDELVAVHLGLCSRDALHIWFPAYNRGYEKYSPGLVLLLKLAEATAARGMQRIDFGRGPERYKQDFKTGEMQLIEGTVEHHAVKKLMRRNWHRAKSWIRATPLRGQLNASLKWSYRFREWLAIR